MELEIDDPRDRPLKQSRSGMTLNRWDALLERWLAGEPIRALAAEYRVSPSTIHHQANKLNKRKKDRRDAVRLAKGPAPTRVITGPDGVERVVCAELAFVFHRDDPVATVASIYDRVEPAAADGAEPTVMKLFRMGGASVRLARQLGQFCEWRQARNAASAPVEGEAGSAGTLELRWSQRPPDFLPDGGDWSTWLFLGGRGAGKTLAGASWLADQAEALGKGGRLALIGPTLHDVREVMIEGVSGLRSLPRWTAATRPSFEPSRRRLVFANGCVAHAFSAEDPDSLRGPQFSAAWADEFCAWPAAGSRGAGETLALLRMGLRLPGVDGDPPRLVVTTTPRPTRALIGLRDEAGCALTHAGTATNAAHLTPGFLERLRDLYGGTRREAQELEGRVVDLDGALFTAEMMARARELLPSPLAGEGKLERLIVAIDPTTTVGGDACGIVVVGSRRRPDGVREAVVLADRSAHGLSPDQWARRAVAAATEFNAGALVVEVNQGGDMVRAVLKTAGCALRIRKVRATRGKRVRAEPVAALYEQGRVRHAPAGGVPLAALEEELMAFGGEMEGAGSLDRADALVWAVTDLLIDAPEGDWGPRVRVL